MGDSQHIIKALLLRAGSAVAEIYGGFTAAKGLFDFFCKSAVAEIYEGFTALAKQDVLLHYLQ